MIDLYVGLSFPASVFLMRLNFEYFVNRGDTGKQVRRAKTNQFVDKLWFKNMFDAVGENWKNIRSTFTPIFTSGNSKYECQVVPC